MMIQRPVKNKEVRIEQAYTINAASLLNTTNRIRSLFPLDLLLSTLSTSQEDPYKYRVSLL